MRRHVVLEISAFVAILALSIANVATAGETPAPSTPAAKNEPIEANDGDQNATKSLPTTTKSPAESAPPSKPVDVPAMSAAPKPEPSTAPASAGDSAAAPIKTNGTIVAKPVDDPALPVRIPGYELRVLDVQKDVFFHVDNTWVKAAVPIYFYFPTANSERAHSLELLRQARDDARKLGQVSDEKAPELERIIANLETALATLEKTAAP